MSSFADFCFMSCFHVSQIGGNSQLGVADNPTFIDACFHHSDGTRFALVGYQRIGGESRLPKTTDEITCRYFLSLASSRCDADVGLGKGNFARRRGGQCGSGYERRGGNQSCERDAGLNGLL